MKKRVICLLAVGLLHMLGDLSGIAPLKGVGVASNASPAPKVFCSARGLETFSSRFKVVYRDEAGAEQELFLTPQTRMNGPYNRRNVFGAALAYGPILPDSLKDPVLNYALGDQGVLKAELGLPESARDIRVVVLPKVAPPSLNCTLEVGEP